MDAKTFQTRLFKLRNDTGLSQKELAKKIGVSQASINYWEKGQRTPSIDAVQKLADFFNVPISELLDSNTTNIIDDMVELFSNSNNLRVDMKGTKMNELFIKLNEKGQDKAIEHIELLNKIPEYRKNEE